MTLLKRRILRMGAVSGAALLAASCAETQLGVQAVKEVARSDTKAQPTQELAPEAFDVTGLTIWDGASTLEGVWIAHPLAQRAQRVQVSNQENQIAIEGAMFRRDPTLSGPSILVSSDAARQLGLQPGVPTELRIIALREGVYAEPTATAAAVGNTAATSPAETSTVETAALPAPEPVESEVVDVAPAPVEETTETPIVAETETTPTVADADTPEPAEQVAAAPEPAPAAPAPASRVIEPPKSAITADDLRGDTTVAAAPAQPAPEPPKPVLAETETTAAVQPTPAPPTPTQPAPAPAAQPTPTGDTSGPYVGNLPSGRFVQAGAFGVEPNAASLVQTLKNAGQPAQYVQRDVNGSLLNIVMIGPLPDDAATDAAVAAAEQAGAPGARKVVR